jgi:ribosomal protein S12 methylthiotransferase
MSGCFAQYVGDKAPDGVDAVVGTGQFHRLPDLLSRRTVTSSIFSPGGFHDPDVPRPLRRNQLSAYLRLSEGCDHRCTFCTIPQLRGGRRSRPFDDILTEARGLVDRGIQELVLISQDTTDYGGDLSPRRSIHEVLEALVAWPQVARVRVMYAYPSEVDARLIRLLAREPKLCGYLDMPLQHISDRVLKAMKRGWGESRTRALLNRLVASVPHLALRTTFIVGFPGETEADFKKLLTLVETGLFEHVGVFAYSLEERTPSARLPGRVPDKDVAARVKAVVAAQSVVMARRTKARIGHKAEVLIESSPEGWIARTSWQAPEVDGTVLLKKYPGASGVFATRITGQKGINLTGSLI